MPGILVLVEVGGYDSELKPLTYSSAASAEQLRTPLFLFPQTPNIARLTVILLQLSTDLTLHQ